MDQNTLNISCAPSIQINHLNLNDLIDIKSQISQIENQCEEQAKEMSPNEKIIFGNFYRRWVQQIENKMIQMRQLNNSSQEIRHEFQQSAKEFEISKQFLFKTCKNYSQEEQKIELNDRHIAMNIQNLNVNHFTSFTLPDRLLKEKKGNTLLEKMKSTHVQTSSEFMANSPLKNEEQSKPHIDSLEDKNLSLDEEQDKGNSKTKFRISSFEGFLKEKAHERVATAEMAATLIDATTEMISLFGKAILNGDSTVGETSFFMTQYGGNSKLSNQEISEMTLEFTSFISEKVKNFTKKAITAIGAEEFVKKIISPKENALSSRMIELGVEEKKARQYTHNATQLVLIITPIELPAFLVLKKAVNISRNMGTMCRHIVKNEISKINLNISNPHFGKLSQFAKDECGAGKNMGNGFMVLQQRFQKEIKQELAMLKNVPEIERPANFPNTAQDFFKKQLAAGPLIYHNFEKNVLYYIRSNKKNIYQRSSPRDSLQQAFEHANRKNYERIFIVWDPTVQSVRNELLDQFKKEIIGVSQLSRGEGIYPLWVVEINP